MSISRRRRMRACAGMWRRTCPRRRAGSSCRCCGWRRVNRVNGAEITQSRMSSRVQALDWLPRDVGDDLEVLIKVQHGKPGEFRDGGDDQVGKIGRAVLAPVSE